MSFSSDTSGNRVVSNPVGATLVLQGGGVLDGGNSYRILEIDNLGGDVIVDDLTLRNGSADNGGAIRNSSPLGNIEITNSTLEDNSASVGGGIFNGDGGNIDGGNIEITNSTLEDNSAFMGGGIFNDDGGDIAITNSIVADNASNDCVNVGTWASEERNMDSDGSCPDFDTDDPLLAPLGDNGGPTETMALQEGSPAIDAATNCPPPGTDQRDVSRPQGEACDLGAFELEAEEREFTLTIEGAGNGSGTVTDDDNSINCDIVEGDADDEDNDCEATFDGTTEVTLEADANEESQFVEWGADCEGTDEGTTVTMDEDKTCEATFDPEPDPDPFTLTIGGQGTGSGTVTDGGIDCDIDDGDTSGDCEGSDAETSVSMDADKQCTAEFSEAEVTNGDDRDSRKAGGAESTVAMLQLTNLVSRYRDVAEIEPGQRNAIVAVAAVCDGSVAQSADIRVLPPTTATVPTLDGGLASVPCLRPEDAAGDGTNTGLSAARLRFSGPGAHGIGTVRLWVDLCGQSGSTRGGAQCLAGAYSDRSGGDGVLFQPGELSAQRVAVADGRDAHVQFGQPGGQILTTGTGVPIMALDPLNLPDPTEVNPLLLIFTADIDSNAQPGPIDVSLTLFAGNDSAQGPDGICVSGAAGVFFPASVVVGNCGSQLLELGALANQFSIVAPEASNATPAVQSASIPSGVRFRAMGQDVAEFGVRVFDLSGQPVWNSGMRADSTLRWDSLNEQGQPVANGVYLYRATVETATGATVRTPVTKLVIMR